MRHTTAPCKNSEAHRYGRPELQLGLGHQRLSGGEWLDKSAWSLEARNMHFGENWVVEAVSCTQMIASTAHCPRQDRLGRWAEMSASVGKTR
jgi:hypothetical protein